MKISIITVCLNAERTIRTCLESIFSQKHLNRELIVVDGASSDGTLDILRGYGKEINKLITEPDDGLYFAMNKGLSIATGDVIGVLNADDLFADPQVLTRIAEVFLDDLVQCMYGDLLYVGEMDTEKVFRYWHSGKYAENAFRKGWHPPHPTFYIRQETYRRYGGFRERFRVSSDFEFMLRYLERYRLNVEYLPKVLVKMRLGGVSNNSVRNIVRGNRECAEAFRINGMSVPFAYPVIRLLPKIRQFVRKKANAV